MSLVIIDAPTLLDGAPQLLHQAWAEWWLAQPDHTRQLLELLHQGSTRDVVATPGHVEWL